MRSGKLSFVGEVLSAALWCKEQDVSEGFAQILSSMLSQIGFDDVSQKIN
jgi:hypothetical protein